MTDIFTRYVAGEATATETARTLYADLQEVEEMYKRADAAKSELRAQLQAITAREGGNFDFGTGKAKIMPGGVTSSYDTKKLDSYLVTLVAHGYSDIAAEIAALKSEKPRSDSLRFDKP